MPAAEAAEAKKHAGLGFFTVIISSGWLGVIIWLGLGATLRGRGARWPSTPSSRSARRRSCRTALVERGPLVHGAGRRDEGAEALRGQRRARWPTSCPPASRNVKEGFDVIQDVVGVAADLESEKLMQRVAYLNVCANLAPMLGLLGTVQGMIYAFATLATHAGGRGPAGHAGPEHRPGAVDDGGRPCAWPIPAISFYTFFRNRATTVILGMEALTMDLIKSLRNVEVVEE